jgi:hypothetical protein
MSLQLPSIEAQALMRLLVENLGMAHTLDLLVAEARDAARRCGTSESYRKAAENYLSVAYRVEAVRKDIFPKDSRNAL